MNIIQAGDKMDEIVREIFEKVSFPNFGQFDSTITLQRSRTTGEYKSAVIEDHWQTFQEGWEEAVKYLKNKSNPSYTDIVSDGGMDPR